MPPSNRLRRKWARWRELQPWERRLAFRLLCLLPLTWLGLRLVGTRPLLKWAQRRRGDKRPPSPPAFDSRRCARLTRSVAAACLPPGSCLPQALVLCRVLTGRGLPARVRIGVKRQDGPLLAHAWVEVNGDSLDPVPADYVPFERGRNPDLHRS